MSWCLFTPFSPITFTIFLTQGMKDSIKSETLSRITTRCPFHCHGWFRTTRRDAQTPPGTEVSKWTLPDLSQARWYQRGPTSLIVPSTNGLLLPGALRATGGACAAKSPTEAVVLIAGLSSKEWRLSEGRAGGKKLDCSEEQVKRWKIGLRTEHSDNWQNDLAFPLTNTLI